MSLIDEAMTKCIILDKKTRPDGLGGVITDYIDGAEVMAAIVYDNSLQSRVAQKQGVKSVYTVTTSKSVLFQYHDIFKRLEDGKIFRVTSDGDDKHTPNSSRLNLRQVTAEEFQI